MHVPGQGDESQYYLIERYSYQIIDTQVLEKSKSLESKQYEPKLPSLNQDKRYEHLITQRANDKIQVLHDDQLILEFDYFPDNSVIQHIAFLENVGIHHEDKMLCLAAFRHALHFLFNQHTVKKLELFTHQDNAIALCQDLGFWMRGEKIASFCEGGEYYNELGVEYSFFDIDDAKLLLNSFKQDEGITDQLYTLQNIINLLEEDKSCDILGKNYLANIVYQIVRDELLDQKLFVSLGEKPWEQVLQQCP